MMKSSFFKTVDTGQWTRNFSSVFKWIPIIALLVYTYAPTFVWMFNRWTARDTYYGHGFLIPLITGYWIYKRRHAFDTQKKSGNTFAILFIFSGLLIQMVASVLRIYFVSAFSLVFVLLGIVGLLWGKNTLKTMWFPLAFLLLMIPLPLLFISQITFKMKFFVSEIATYLINATGIAAVRNGSYIVTHHAVVLVGDPCSGLRSFLAFLCLGVVFAYESRFPIWKRAVLVFCGLPLAILSNVLRIYAMGIIGDVYGMKYTTGIVHDSAGYIVFIIAIFGFIWIRQLLGKEYAKS